jgi:hypothetical protein
MVMTSNLTPFMMDLGEIVLGRDEVGVTTARVRAIHTLPAIVGFTVGYQHERAPDELIKNAPPTELLKAGTHAPASPASRALRSVQDTYRQPGAGARERSGTGPQTNRGISR